jgi:hypothetical protein
MTNQLDKFYDAMHDMMSLQYELLGLARAFEVVGNDKISWELKGFSERVNTAHEIAKKTVNEQICRSIEVAQENTVNVLGAVLAGVEIGSKS